MARKKKEETIIAGNKKDMPLSEKQKVLDKIAQSGLDLGYGVGGRPGSNPTIDKRLKLRYIPTDCREYNIATGGGLPVGKITIISGEPDSGKTGLLLSTIAKNQAENPNFYAAWCETENSLTDEAIDFFKIDRNRFHAIYINPKSGAEGMIDLLKTYAASGYIDLIVVNSLKMLVPRDEQDKPMSNETIAMQARMNSKMMKKMATILDENECTLALVQHLSTQIGGYSGHGVPMTLSGGVAIRHSSMLTTEQKRMALLDKDPITKEEGLKIKVTVKKNHCVWGRNPYVSFEYLVSYKEGIEKILSTLKLLIESNVLEQKGAWIYMFDSEGNKIPEYSWNGKAAFKADMEANPEKIKKLTELLGRYSTVKDLSDEEIEEIQKEDEEIDEVMRALEESEDDGDDVPMEP